MKFRLLCIFLGLLQFPCTSQTQKMNGVSFVAASEAIDQTNVDPVMKVNANYAAIMPFGFMRKLSATEVIHNTDRQWFGETRKGAKQYSELLQKNKIKIMIKPQIWVWNGEFTGFIEMESEEDWKAFEKSYESIILEYAGLAQEIKADMYCIGTELHKFVAARPAFWKELITKVKKVYKGKLTYAENWDSFHKVPFWEGLDFIGIDAYFPLSEEKMPSLETLQAGWQPHKKKIMELSKKLDRKVVFTEYGYRSMDYTGKEPWDSSRKGKVLNLKAQEIALQALFNEFWKEEWFAGGFIWKWFHNYERSGGLENHQFTPQNKPAEKVLRENYKVHG
ncbi:glycoside hydrolase [Kordia sp.]|uniref:glycoside hydrolase family 113 n=1 Tax=Kordia sp. TaxID=1965332 RepID=UPI0025C67F49|nr:glycoside hydrolase [Kordia sp.]MCH2196292.1 glycoside hydrolase [Kordia sp.]